MAQHDLLKLAAQGRAFDATRPWTEEELISLEALIGAGLERVVAAEYIRNGITTVKMYEAAVAAGFQPKSLDTLRADAVAAHQKEVREQLGLSEDEAEEVSETDEVAEPEVETVSEETVETDEVSETDEVAETVAETEGAKEKAPRGNSRGGKK